MSSMKWFYSLILFLLNSFLIHSQLFVVSPTKLYKEPNLKSTQLGLLLRSARVDLLEPSSCCKKTDDAKEFVKVRVDNGMEGYVKSSFLKKSLNIHDNYNPSPKPIIENDGHYGSPHLFITVASLRGRQKPTTKSKVVKKFTMGQPVGIHFYPYNNEAWVKIKECFVQQKFLGARPVIEKLYKKFDDIPKEDVKERFKIGQRLWEFSWNSTESKIPALQRFLEVAHQLGDKKLIAKTELELLAVKGEEQTLSFEEKASIEKSKKTYLILNGIKLTGYDLSLEKLLKIKGKPQKVIKVEDDCCYVGSLKYVYNDAEFMISKSENIAEIVKIYFSKKNKYVIDGFVIDNNTKESVFVEKFARVFYYNGFSPNMYDFPFLEYATIVLNFKNNKPSIFSFHIWP